jgi:hypothetical protein
VAGIVWNLHMEIERNDSLVSKHQIRS